MLGSTCHPEDTNNNADNRGTDDAKDYAEDLGDPGNVEGTNNMEEDTDNTGNGLHDHEYDPTQHSVKFSAFTHFRFAKRTESRMLHKDAHRVVRTY